MTWWKQIVLGAYYQGTRPYRVRHNRRLCAAGDAPVIALYYHRVADDAANPWTTSNAEFRRHIEWLAARFEFVSLAEAQERVRARRSAEPVVTITFDDGYADNCDMALPYLVDRKIPFTYFVTTDAVLLNRPFPHDLAMGNDLRPNSLKEIISLAEAGVEIGAHTRTHANLGAIDDVDALYDEVIRASEELQAALPTPVRYFAFPFGMYPNLNGRVFDMAHSAGFEGVCSAYGGYNFPGDDAFHIQRIGADGPLVRIKNAATLDPLRYMNVPRYDYDLSSAAEDDLAEVYGGMSTAIATDIPKTHDRAGSLRTDTLAASVVFLMALSCVQPVIAFGRDFLFALWLTPDQLGRWGVAFSYVMLAAPLAVLGITGSFGADLNHYQQRGHLQTFLRRTGLACALLTIVAVCVIHGTASWLSVLVFNTAEHTEIISQMSFCLISLILYGYVTESLTALRLFRIVSVLHFVKGVLFASLGLSLLVFWRLSASSIIIALSVACYATSAVALRWLLPACFAESEPRPAPLPHRQLWQKLLPFAFGIWIVNALANLFGMIDRYMIVHHGGMSPVEAMTEIGYYQSSRMVPLLFIGFAGMLGSLTLPHLTHDWERGNRQEVSRTLHLALKIFALALFAGGTVLIVGSPLLYHVGLQGKYDGGLAVLPWTMIYCAWFSLNVLVELYLFCSEKAYLSAVALGAGLIANIALNLALLPVLGLAGAVLATAAATFVVLVLGFVLGHRMGLALDGRTIALVLLMPALALGPWGASITLLAVITVVVQTNWLLSCDEKQRLYAVLGGYAEKLMQIVRKPGV